MGATITGDMLKGFERALKRDERGAATVEKYLRNVRQFAEWLGGAVLTREALAAWKNALVEGGNAPSTVNGKLAAVHALLRCIGRDDCRVRFLKVQRRLFRDASRDLSRSEYLKLVKTAYEQGQERLALAMEAICSCGVRVSELRHITVEALARGQATIRCKGKLRTVLLPSALCAKLARYARRRGIAAGPVFVTRSGRPLSRRQIWGEMKALCRAAGVAAAKVFPHNLRHLFAVEYYREDRDIVKLADVLGHSSIDTTRIYLVTTGVEHRRHLDNLGLVLGWRCDVPGASGAAV